MPHILNGINTQLQAQQHDTLTSIYSLYYYSHFNERPELDYALIRPRPNLHIVNNVELFPSPYESLQLPAFTSEEEFSNLPRTSVRAVTASAGEVVGVLDHILSFLIIPGTSALQKVYEVEFSVPLALGDAGAWVFDASNGSLLGHIVAGILESGVALIVPAYQVFADLAAVVSPDLAQEPSKGCLHKEEHGKSQNEK
jgi:hypothetical protein